MSNELDVGTRRQGGLVDFDPATPKVTVTLERSVDGISLTIPWSDYDSPYAEWFVDRRLEGVFEQAPRSVPRRLLFQDPEGSVMLVGCRSRGYHTTFDGPGSGRVWAQFAILGVADDVDFQLVNGLRSEVSGLRIWLGMHSVSENFERLSDPPRTVMSISATAASEIEVLHEGGLRIQPSWSLERGEGTATLQDLAYAESRSSSPLDWFALQKTHLALRDLLVISQWRAETQNVVAVLRHDDSVTMPDGVVHDNWRDVVPSQIREEPELDGLRRFLIPFNEIGVEGLKKWLQLRDDFARALDPIISARYLDRVSPTTLLAQTGPGAEALGYLLLLRDGSSAKVAANASLHTRLSRIFEDIKGVVPFDGRVWATETASVYNALKHANRATPAEIDVLNRWQETVLAVRAWVAIELGSDPENLKARLLTDPQSSPFEVVG